MKQNSHHVFDQQIIISSHLKIESKQEYYRNMFKNERGCRNCNNK